MDSMEVLCMTHLNDLRRVAANEVCGYIKSKDDYDSFLLDLSCNGFSYSVRSSGTHTNDSRPFICDPAGFFYKNIRRMDLRCSYGSLYYQINKSNNQEQSDAKKRRIHKTPTKKIGCPSKMNVKIREVYPEYFLDSSNINNKTMKSKICQDLKNKVAEGCSNIRVETWYFVQASLKHNHEISGENLPIHHELRTKIEELVETGVTSIPIIQYHLQEKVKEMFKDVPVPDPSNTAFFPKHKAIRNQVYRVLSMKDSSETHEDIVMNDEQGDFILDEEEGVFIKNDGERDFIMNEGQVNFIVIDEPGSFIIDENDGNCVKIEACSDADFNKDHDYIEKCNKKPSRPQYKHPKRLALLRKKLKNIIQISYTINDGEHINQILQQISSIEEEISHCPKKTGSVDNS